MLAAEDAFKAANGTSFFGSSIAVRRRSSDCENDGNFDIAHMDSVVKEISSRSPLKALNMNTCQCDDLSKSSILKGKRQNRRSFIDLQWNGVDLPKDDSAATSTQNTMLGLKLTKQMLVKILVIGNPKCGKTSTIERYTCMHICTCLHMHADVNACVLACTRLIMRMCTYALTNAYVKYRLSRYVNERFDEKYRETLGADFARKVPARVGF